MSDLRLLDVEHDPVASREFSLGPCQVNTGHCHNYAHRTFVLVGAVRVFYTPPGEDEERESVVFKEGKDFLVKPEVMHRIEPILPEPGSWKEEAVRRVLDLMRTLGVERWELAPQAEYACVFAHRDAETGVGVERYPDSHDAAYE